MKDVTVNLTVKFTFERFNPRRAARGAESAEIKVDWGDGTYDLLWMSEKDLKRNIQTFGPCEAFTTALEAYKNNKKV